MRKTLSVVFVAVCLLPAFSAFAASPDTLEPTVVDMDPTSYQSTAVAPPEGRSDLSRRLGRQGRRQMLATPGVLLAGGVSLFPLLFTGFPDGNCERNKVSCSSYSVGDFTSVGDDIGVGFAFAGVTTALAGTSMLFAIGGQNRQLSRLTGDDASIRAQRAIMLDRYGRRTQWAAVGVISASAISAIVGGALYAKNHDRCELGDCPVVPAATKTIVASAIIGTVTGGMMLGVGTRARTRGARGAAGDQNLSLSFSPFFAGDGGGGTMNVLW